MSAKVRELIGEQELACVQPGANLLEASRKMAEVNVGILPVCEEGGKCLGVLTDRDIVCRGLAKGGDMASFRVADLMTKDVLCISEDETVENAAKLMGEKAVRRLVVCPADKSKISGIISLGDIATCAGCDKLACDALKAIMHQKRTPRT